jgi:hypothetical protein
MPEHAERDRTQAQTASDPVIFDNVVFIGLFLICILMRRFRRGVSSVWHAAG